MASDDPPNLFWFGDDLRLDDNPGLNAACADGRPLFLLYVLDDESGRPLGGAARWWLHHSLECLSHDLAGLGQTLVLRRGRADTVVPELVGRHRIDRLFFNRRYGPAAATAEAVVNRAAEIGCGISVHSANLLYEPDQVMTGKGEPFRVYSAFWRAARRFDIQPAVERPDALPPPLPDIETKTVEALGLLPREPDWAGGLRETWTPGEAGAADRLSAFRDEDLSGYAKQRDFPAEEATSMLSPHLRFGEISAVRVWHEIDGMTGDAKYKSELGWREFAYHVLDRNPDLATRNLRQDFDRFPWREPDTGQLEAWQKGQTGYPIVDAGMRQLWQTGWMHNRVRMVVASFLTKHLLFDWREGERWFWDTLVDADPANNPFGWQWVAGSGYDAQPFFRIFNPVLQGEKFDPKGTYVRRFVPEVAALPDRFIHKPWEASPVELRAAGVTLGDTYPEPIFDHKGARSRALGAFAEIKSGSDS